MTKRLGGEEKKLAEIQVELQGKTQGLQKSIEGKQLELAPWVEKMNHYTMRMKVAGSEHDMLESKIESTKTAISTARNRIDELKGTLADKKGEHEANQQESSRMKLRVKEISQELADDRSKYADVKSEMNSVTHRLDDCKSSVQTMQDRGNVHTQFMKQKRGGTIKGICDRLGNLGTIDDKYDIAVSTACGGSLDLIIVETVDVGQRCIDFLKKNNLGRGNFVCLDKIRKQDMSSISTPESVPRLFDLIKAKESRFLPAFFQILGNTLVAKDMEQANRIAYGSTRYRVVTLDGKLIDTSGTMTGGGSRPSKGGMSSKQTSDVNPELIFELGKTADLLKAKFDEIRYRITNGESELNRSTKAIDEFISQESIMSVDIESLLFGLQDAKKNLEVAK